MRCAAIKKDGSRCSAGSLPGAEWCYNHHPERAEERKRNAAKAGKRGGKGRGFKTTGEIPTIKARLLEIAEDVLAHRQSSGAAAVAGQLYNAVLRAIEIERKVREQEEVLTRLEALERRYEQNGDKRYGFRG